MVILQTHIVQKDIPGLVPGRGGDWHKVCYFLWRRWNSLYSEVKGYQSNQQNQMWVIGKFYERVGAWTELRWFCRMTSVQTCYLTRCKAFHALRHTFYFSFFLVCLNMNSAFCVFRRSSVGWINLHSFCNVNRFAALLTSPSNNLISSTIVSKTDACVHIGKYTNAHTALSVPAPP